MSLVTSAVVRLEGWETDAIKELVSHVQEAVSFLDESSHVLSQQFGHSGVVTSGKLSRYTKYRELFAVALRPDFISESVQDARVVIGVSHEAVEDALETFVALLQMLNGLPKTDKESLQACRDKYIPKWSNLRDSLLALRRRCNIPDDRFIARPDQTETDSNAVKFFRDMLVLFADMRTIVTSTIAEVDSFVAWTGEHMEKFSACVGPSGPNIHNETMVLSEELKIVRGMLMREDLDSLLEDATEFESVVKKLEKRVISVNQLSISSSLGSCSQMPPVASFGSQLTQVLIPKWRRIAVSASVFRSRILTAVERRAEATLLERERSNSNQAIAGLMKMVSPAGGGGESATEPNEEAPVDQSIPETTSGDFQKFVDIMIEVGNLHKECGDFLYSSYAKVGLVGVAKFSGFPMYSKIFAGYATPEFVTKYSNQTSKAIAVAHDTVHDARKYIVSLLVELGTLAASMSNPSLQSTISTLALRWDLWHQKLADLRTKYNLGTERVLPIPKGLYISDETVVSYLKRMLKGFTDMRSLVQASFDHLRIFQTWIQTHSRDYSRIVATSPPSQNLLVNITSVIEEFKAVKAVYLHETLDQLVDDSHAMESMALIFSTRVFELMQEVAKLSLRKESQSRHNPVLEFRTYLSNTIYPGWVSCREVFTTLRIELEERSGRLARVSESGSAVYSVAQADEAEREEAIANLIRFAQEDEAATTTPSPKNIKRKPKNLVAAVTGTDQTEPCQANIPSPTQVASEEVKVPVKVEQKRQRRVVPVKSEASTAVVVQPVEQTIEVPTEVPMAQIGRNNKERREVARWIRNGGTLEEFFNTTSAPVEVIATTVAPTVTVREMSKSSTPQPVTGAAAKRQAKQRVAKNQPASVYAAPQAQVRVLQRPVVVDPIVNSCLQRIWQLNEHAQLAYAEIAELCSHIGPRLWPSGNIEGARTVVGTQQLAQAAVANSQVLGSYAYHAWQSQFHRPQ